ADQRFLVQRFKRFTIHPELESAPAPLVKIVFRGNARRTPESGGEQLRAPGEGSTLTGPFPDWAGGLTLGF
ncbi:MAG TPA: hypothetical protein VGT81_12590, partial [Casimicrobiaceae bacterium]|nr:hypothetical protein [Casimicrobiaceae bacterium]